MEKICNHQVMTNRRKVEDVLIKIHNNSEYLDTIQQSESVAHVFDGKVGHDLTFDGVSYHDGERSHDYTDINLQYKSRDWGKITLPQEFMCQDLPVFGADFNGTGFDQSQAIRDAADIAVYSPRWKVDDGVMTNSVDLLRVYHAADETADDVVDKIYTAMNKSLDKTMIAKKLSKLNLPSHLTIKNVDVLADKIVRHIHTQNHAYEKN